MNQYKFETDQFGISESGIHFLRSGYNYKTIEFLSINTISIENGRQIRNWLTVLVIGIFSFCFGIYTFIKIIYEYFFIDSIHSFYVEQFILPILPLLIGLVSIYFAFKKGPVLKIIIEGKHLHLPMSHLEKKKQIAHLKSFLSQNNITKNKFILS